MRRIGMLIALLIAGSDLLAADKYQFSHENVLGTSLELKVNAASKVAADEAERKVLAEIDRLALVYSTYDPKSEMRQWLDGGKDFRKASAELIELLKESVILRARSQGAFDVQVGQAISVWKRAAKSSALPSESDLKAAIDSCKSQSWRIDESNSTVQRLTNTQLTFDGIATGLIVDRACDVALQVAGVDGVMLNIGGDLRAAGNWNETVSIADPRSPGKSLAKVNLSYGAITTSGNYERGFQVGEEWFSHIIDPRTARPASQVISASVIAETTTEADGWATAFSVLTPAESMEICGREKGLACLLVLADGQIVSSPGWPAKVFLTSLTDDPKVVATKDKPDDEKKAANEWNTGAELNLEFEINRAGGNRYRRPYVAVWIEDKDQFPVRTLTLWMQTDDPGPRWHRDLKRWYKQDGLRRLVDDKKLIGTVSAATKPPGEYKVNWDGKDDNDKLVTKGKYTLYIEAAREHGTYQILSKEFTVGDEEVKVDLGKNEEIKSAKFVYKPRGSSK